MAKREKQEPKGDIVIRVQTPEELFTVDSRDLLTGGGRLDCGMDELVEQLLATKRGRRRRVVLEIAGACSSEQVARVEPAVRRYCELRIQRADRQRGVIWRQGIRSLFSGSLLFVVGVVLSFDFTRPEADAFWQELLGNGVFLVVAWVGLWYPLDLLFIARQPFKREARVLSEMLDMPLVVRTAARDAPVPEVAEGAA